MHNANNIGEEDRTLRQSPCYQITNYFTLLHMHRASWIQWCHLFVLPSLQKLSQEFEIKRLSLEEQRNRLQQQLDNLKEELSAKLNMANQEVRCKTCQSCAAAAAANDDDDDGDTAVGPCRCPTSKSWWGRRSRTWAQRKLRSPVWERLRKNWR